jgi:hypothetical protein
LTKLQGFNTPDYWSYIDWYRPGYNSSTKVVAEVNTYSALATLTVAIGSSVKVTANAQGKFEIYLLTDLGYERVALEDGTIEFSEELWDYAVGRFGFDVEVFDAQYFDQEPVKETRKIIQAINEELLIDDLGVQRNKALVLMFDYVLSESLAPEWLVKTSLIDVDHNIRQLIPYQNYLVDNQEFVEDYIQEVKPYHVSVREFNLKYTGFDEFFGDIADFDVPAYYNTSLEIPKFTSPILLPYDQGTAFGSPTNIESDLPATSAVWTTWPWSQWYNNHLLQLDSVTVISGGSGYTEPPVVIITGDALVPAQATALINSAGQVVSVSVTSAGSGYSQTPVVTFDGGNGTAAQAYARMTNDLVRSIRTVIKYDRFQYFSNVQTWSTDGTYQDGQLVRYENRVWQATSADSTAVVGPSFDLEDWTEIAPSALTGVDRTMGYYQPGVNQPGLELPLLIDGVDYPGVQVYGNYFSGTPLALDAVYSSEFTDTGLGTLPTDINVEGGEFVGLYEGHAPEELVNGAEFDTLDFRVYTRPGADWNRDGHGFQWSTIRYTYEPAIATDYSWAGLVENPVQVLVSNVTTGLDLAVDIDYTVDWVNQTVALLTAVVEDVFQISVYELGGGSQLYRENYIGGDIGETVVVPVNSAEITSIAVFVNGENVGSVTWEPYADSTVWNTANSYNKLAVVNNNGDYYRALQDVPIGTAISNTLYWFEFVPAQQSLVDFGTEYGATDGVAIVVFGTYTVDAGNFVIGKSYTITTIGTTNWVSIGASSAAVGVSFVATGTGTGTGQASSAYSWSTPQTQIVIVNADTAASKNITMTNSVQGSNPANAVVTRNGLRLRPPAGIEWIGDDSTIGSYPLPQRLGFSQSLIFAPSEVSVWVDNILQNQIVGPSPGTYTVTAYDGTETREVLFVTPPPSGSRILISVSTLADYVIVGEQLQITATVNINDVFAITTWNDTAQQFPLTLVFVGPVTQGFTVTEGYDNTVYDPLFVDGAGTGTYPAGQFIIGNTYTILTAGDTDFVALGAANNIPGTVFITTGIGSGTGTATGTTTVRSSATDAFNNTAGSYDFSIGVSENINDFYLQRSFNNASRLWVTLDGERLFEGVDYTVQGDYLVLASGVIGPAQVMVIEQYTNSIVPDAMAFRIFQDMRGVQATYRITNATTTTLAQALTSTANVAYVTNAEALSQPDLAAGIFGVITIDGERIMYRERNTALNTISGLMRGTAGTGADDHDTGAEVYDTGRGNLLAEQFQDYVVSDSTLGDDSTTVFYAPSIRIGNFEDSAVEVSALEVYVGGMRQYAESNDGSTLITTPSQYRWNCIDGGGPDYTDNEGNITHNPLTIEFVVDNTVYPPLQAPAAGSEVTILVRQGVTWYAPGTTTASDGIALQDTDTVAARFLRGA